MMRYFVFLQVISQFNFTKFFHKNKLVFDKKKFYSLSKSIKKNE